MKSLSLVIFPNEITDVGHTTTTHTPTPSYTHLAPTPPHPTPIPHTRPHTIPLHPHPTAVRFARLRCPVVCFARWCSPVFVRRVCFVLFFCARVWFHPVVFILIPFVRLRSSVCFAPIFPTGFCRSVCFDWLCSRCVFRPVYVPMFVSLGSGPT
jgi:hypothetical protein